MRKYPSLLVAALLLPCLLTACKAEHPPNESGQNSSQKPSQGQQHKPQSAAAPDATTSNGGARKSWVVPDPMLQMPAATASLPADWGFAGTTVHVSNCVVTGHSIVFSAQSRDGLSGFEKLPALRAQFVSDPRTLQRYQSQGCLVARSMNAAEFIRMVVLPRLRPGAQVVSSGPEPLLAQTMQGARQQLAGMPRVRGMQVQVDAARVKITDVRNGHPVEEFVSAMLVCSRSDQQYPGMAPMTSVDCTADPVTVMRAPAGQLATLAAHESTILQLDMNPAWEQRINQVSANEGQQARQNMAAQAQQNMANSVAQSNATVDAIHRTGAASMQNARNAQNAIDQSAGATAAHMGDYNNYTNPATGQTYQLSNQYTTTYQDAQGNILQTNSAYSPGPSSWWTELTPQYR